MNTEALKNLLYRMADDELLSGHQMSQWCGTAPLLEEDLAFSSIAQDKLGHALQNYTMLEALGEVDPDTNGFRRSADKFTCCHFVQLPIGDYAFSLVRQFLFDNAEYLRYQMLKNSSYTPLAQFSGKAVGELRYHVMHGDEWIKKLANSTDEALLKIQKALDYAIPYTLGIFEITSFENNIISEGIFEGEEVLKSKWIEKIDSIISETQLKQIDWKSVEAKNGGRKGVHTEYLAPTLLEMGEVINSESAEIDW